MGRKVAATKEGNDAEIKTLQYLRDYKTGTEDELYVVGGERHVLRKLKDRGLVVELTSN